MTSMEAKPNFLITGGIHGEVFEPIAAISQLMNLIDPSQLGDTVMLVPVG